MSRSSQTRVGKGIRNTSTYAMVTCSLSCVVKIITAYLGKTSLQTVDCIRSIVETAVIILWWYACTSKRVKLTPEREEKLDRTIRTGMVATAVLMLIFAVFRFISGGNRTGALLSGMILAFLFGLNNINVYIGYRKRHSDLDSVKEQSRLFLVKAAADGCVCLTLLIMMLKPEWPYVNHFQLASSVVVAGAMAFAALQGSRDIGDDEDEFEWKKQ